MQFRLIKTDSKWFE